MRRFLRVCFHVACFAYAAPLTIVYELYFLVLLGVFLLLRRGSLEDAWRLHNWRFGAYMIRLFWPMIRVRRRGLEHVPSDVPVMVVANHRSFFDIFFFGLVPRRNITTLVRSWPFRLPVLGWFMRAAGYVDIERLSFDDVVATVERLAARGVSSLCFPEGHRSPDGRLQRFRSGAFRMAAACNLPVVPVCMTGTEQLFKPGCCSPIKPVHVDIEIMPAVNPASFPCEHRALKLRRHVERAFRLRLGE
ncbi:MAG: lysophospholipid acyltransferase family protein [Phycisphaerae bacterium]